jgi:hypothetical protein
MLLVVAVIVTACGWRADATVRPRSQDILLASQRPAGPQQSTPEAPAAPDQQAKRGVSGVYLCEGTNPDGSAYKGFVEIAALNSTYLVHWVMADGVEVLGVGILKSNMLSVSYFGGTPAVAVYRVDGDRLVGEWTMGGAEGKIYSETLTRMADQQAPRPNRPARPARPRPSGRGITI